MDSDASFFELMTTFSKLGLNQSSAEKCPLCQSEFLSSQFAEHVYFCIKSLDTVEDEKFAQSVEI